MKGTLHTLPHREYERYIEDQTFLRSYSLGPRPFLGYGDGGRESTGRFVSPTHTEGEVEGACEL